MFELTDEQKCIVEYQQSCVVVAQPSSGKTSTIAIKIKRIFDTLPEYKGVIAISYTNKASDELKCRVLEDTVDVKGSFIGTIDKFYISEIVLPFIKHLWGRPSEKVQVKRMGDLGDDDQELIKNILSIEYAGLTEEKEDFLREIYLKGTIVLELVGVLALFAFDKSTACRRYITARYSHIIIDEYQDSGLEQHQLFMRIQSLGIIAIAFGDVNQSIYAFPIKIQNTLLCSRKIRKSKHILYQLITGATHQ